MEPERNASPVRIAAPPEDAAEEDSGQIGSQRMKQKTLQRNRIRMKIKMMKTNQEEARKEMVEPNHLVIYLGQEDQLLVGLSVI